MRTTRTRGPADRAERRALPGDREGSYVDPMTTNAEGAHAPVVCDRVGPLMERLLRDAGLTTGMRVLDAGCGRGDVSSMVARLVGPTGLVVGIDRDAGAIEAARERMRAEGHASVELFVGDLLSARSHGAPFDAVVERRVLMYQPDGAAAVRALAECLRPGGIFAFQEADATMIPASSGATPLHDRVIRWAWQTVAREGACTSMGLLLPGLLEAAGLALEGIRAEAVVQTASHRHVTASIVRAILPRIVARGIATEAEVDVETLDARLEHELRATGQAFVSDVAISAWGRRR